MATNAITTQIRIDADSAIKALKNVEAGFDGTESSAQRAAAQIDAMTDVIRANAQQAKASGDALATALGPDFVSDLERAGGSVDGLVADLRKAGVTFEDMAADADALAASLKRAQDAGNELGTNVSRAASDAESGLTRVAHAGDNSRSVLANLVGNSVQDLGALGGVAGTAGMALGQLAEYATEGNISLGGLAGVAGPMIGVAGAVAGVVYVMGQLQQAAADVTAEMETLKGVRLDVMSGNNADAAAKLAEQYANTVPLLEKYGYTSLALTDTLAGNGDVIEALNVKLDAVSEAYDSVQLAAYNGDATAQALSEQYGAQSEELISLIDTLTNGQSRYAEVAAEQERMTTITNALTDALDMSADALSGAAGNVVVGGYALDEFTQKTIDAKSELIRYVLELNEVPPDVKTDLRAAVKAGDIATINAILAAWAQGVDVPVRIYTVGDAQGALGGAAAGSKSLAGRFTPAKVGGGGGGGGGGGSSGSGGGGGGGGKTPEQEAKEAADAWDEAMARAYAYGEISREEYRKYLEGQMADEDKYSDEYYKHWQERQRLDKEEADAKKKAADEEKKALDEREKADKEQAKRDEEKIQRQQEIAAMFEAARSAAAETFNNGPRSITIYTAGGGEEVVQAIKAYERNNGTGWRS